MATRPEDVETARGRLERDLIILTPNGTSKSYRMVDAEDLRTILASHAAQAGRIASLEAVLEKARVAIACHSPDPTEPLEEIDALLSGKASA